MTESALPGLFGWQAESLKRALRGPFLAAAAPGAGKTRFGAAWALCKIQTGAARRIAIVAPNALLRVTWPREIASYAPTSGLRLKATHTLPARSRFDAMFDRDVDLVTITPDLMPSFAKEVIETKRCPIDGLLIDESQLFRAADSKRTQALHTVARCVPIQNVLLLSGSPQPNSSADLWSPGAMLSRYESFWGDSFWAWRARHFTKVGAFGWRPKAGTDEAVRNRIKPFSVAVDLRRATDVPREVFTDAPFTFGREHTQRIERFIAERTLQIADREIVVDDGDDGRFLGTLRQLTSGFAYHPETREAVWFDRARLDALGDLIEVVPTPKLIPISFRAEAQAIAKRCSGVVRIDGDTPIRDRAGIVDDFNADWVNCLVIAPAAAGHGLNLQMGSAQTVIWFSRGFSWELKAQVEARLIRTGQRRVVSVVTLMANVGLDEAISSVLARKSAGEAAVMAALAVPKRG